MQTFIGSTRALDNAALQQLAPSVFATHPWEGVNGGRGASERYMFLPTIEIVEALRERDFFPVRAQQSRANIGGRVDFVRHMLRFRHADYLAGAMKVGDEIPEIVLTNSHDLSTQVQVDAGIFRLACMNGMVVASEMMDNLHIKVRHIGDVDKKQAILDATYEVASVIPQVMGQVETWKRIELTRPQQVAFANAALELKDNKIVLANDVLRRQRPQDTGNDLWTVTNVVQEHLLKGGDRGKAKTGRRTTTKAVKSVSEDLRLNRALWKLSEEYAKLATTN